MADRTDTPRPNGSGSIASTADFEARLAAESEQGLEGPAPTHSAAAALTHRLNRLTREVSESRQRGEQLKSSLEKSTRRMQQLIGERDRLASLLAERDAELQRLNRELGALTERAVPAVRGSPTFLGAAASAMLGKSGIPGRRRGTRSHRMHRRRRWSDRRLRRPLLPWVKEGSPKPVLGVVVFGLSETEIESVLGIVERHCTERDLAPLLLTDNDAFQLFRGRRVLFEFLPARAEQERFAADLDWRLFTLRRLALIRRKWQPVRVIAFGRSAAEVVQLWLEFAVRGDAGSGVPERAVGGAKRIGARPRQPSAVRAVKRLAAVLLGLRALAIAALAGAPVGHAQESPSADDAAWAAASDAGSPEACQGYLQAFPAGQHAEEAFGA